MTAASILPDGITELRHVEGPPALQNDLALRSRSSKFKWKHPVFGATGCVFQTPEAVHVTHPL